MTGKKKLSKNNHGMTLVELMVAIGIIGLLTTAVGMAISKTFFINRYVFEQGLNNAELQKSLRDFSTLLREAKQGDSGQYMIYQAEDFNMTFFADIDDDPATERVHYYLENGSLKRGMSEAAGFPPAYPVGDEEIEEVGHGITNTASQPIFYYYNEDYPEDMTDNPMEAPIQVEDISLVKIDIYANIDPGHAPNTMRMETFIRPRNIR